LSGWYGAGEHDLKFEPKYTIMTSTDRFAAHRMVTGAVLISFSGVYVTWVPLGPTASAFYRVFFGGIILLTVAFVRRERYWVSWHYFFLQTLCGLVFALDLIVWHQSIIYIGPGLATILANFQVFFLAFIGIAFLGEPPDRRLLATIPMALAGLVMVVGFKWQSTGSPDYRVGVLLGLATALCYTGYILSLRHLNNTKSRLSPTANLAGVSLISAVFLAGGSLLQGQGFAIPDLPALYALLAYALFSQVLGWSLISKGLPGVPTTIAGLLLLLQPSLAFVWDMLFFDLEVTIISGIGTVLTLGAIYLGTTRKAPRQDQLLKSNNK
jgi:drug/metabolite transporter (DMT)-like permease